MGIGVVVTRAEDTAGRFNHRDHREHKERKSKIPNKLTYYYTPLSFLCGLRVLCGLNKGRERVGRCAD